MSNICQRYARINSEATNSRQLSKTKLCQRLKIEENYLKQIYGKDMPKRTSDPLAVKAVTAVKALQLLHDLYKLSQFRLAVTAQVSCHNYQNSPAIGGPI